MSNNKKHESDRKISKLTLGFWYYFSKPLLIFKILMNRNMSVSTKILGRNIHFNNINCFRIIEKGIKEIDIKRDYIYKNTDCFVDVGAHIGTKTIMFHEVNPEVECLMFEPISTTCDFLRENTKHISKSHIFETAISESEKKVPIFFDEDHLNVSSLNKDHYFLNKNAKKPIKKQEITSKPLDSFFDLIKEKNKIYLKIDVEANEKEVLRGAQKFLSKVKYLEIEVIQDKINPLSETLKLINRKFNIIEIDCLKGEDVYSPKAVNFLIELY